jgi:hypothetical protein
MKSCLRATQKMARLSRRIWARVIRPATFCAVLILSLSTIGRIQAQSVHVLDFASGGTTAKPSLPHVYMHFLLYQNHLDAVATSREKKGKDGSEFRNHFQQQLGFSNAQFAVVRTTGVRLQTELNDLNAQAISVIKAYRLSHPQTPGGPLPPPPPELADLTKQREDLIQKEVAALNSGLGTIPSGRLQDFLQNRFLQETPVAHVVTVPHDAPLFPTQRLQKVPQP